MRLFAASVAAVAATAAAAAADPLAGFSKLQRTVLPWAAPLATAPGDRPPSRPRA